MYDLSQDFSDSEKEEYNYWMPFSELIMESVFLRDINSLTQIDLAKKINSKQSVISRFENMGRLPNYDFLARISKAFDQRLGITLQGDFMAIAPIHSQNEIKYLAKKYKMTTRDYIQLLLDEKINEVLNNNSTITTSDSFSSSKTVELDSQISVFQAAAAQPVTLLAS